MIVTQEITILTCQLLKQHIQPTILT